MSQMAQYSIRKMKEAEVQIAIDWAQKEGWNPGLRDASCFYKADPSGFFIGLLDGEPISVGSAINYDEHFAFCGLYIVKPEYRHSGYGIKLTEERLKHAGDRITGIDGVLQNVKIYERIGYKSSHKQSRFELKDVPSFSSSTKHIVDLSLIPFQSLENFDRKYFPAPRKEFLRCWIYPSNGQVHALGYMENQKLVGYGVIRKCIQGYKIGPLFASSPLIARSLFEALCSKVSQGPIYLDIPDLNKDAHLLVKHYKMANKFEVIRMYRNGFPDVDINGTYGVTTFELG